MVASWNIAGKTAASSELLPSRIVERQRGIWQSPGGCGAVGVSRRKPDAVADKEWLAVDLLDRKAAVAAIQTRPDITDVLYAGYVHGKTMTLRGGRMPRHPQGVAVNFLTTSPTTSRRSCPTALAQHEGNHRREADQADHDHCN